MPFAASSIDLTPKLNLAFAALSRGDAALASAMAEQALSGTAESVDWLLVRALAFSQEAQPLRALSDYQRLVTLEPNVAAHFSNLGNCLLELQRLEPARAALDQAMALGAHDVSTLFAAARAAYLSGHARAALPLNARAQAQAPDDIEIALYAVKIALAIDDLPNALERMDALASAPLSAVESAELGHLNLNAGRYLQAQALFEGARSVESARFDAELGLALCAERSNQLGQAQRWRAELGKRADTFNPRELSKLDLLDARLSLRSKDAAASATLLERLLSQPIDEPGLRPSLNFYLGRAYDHQGLITQAVHAFEQAHATRLALTASAHPALLGDADLLRLLERDVPLFGPRPGAVASASEPIFLVGFPRSGTTLLEQLLHAHPALQSFDEQPFLQRLIDEIERRGLRYPQDLAALDSHTVEVLRARYFERVAQLQTVSCGVRLVDKNPLNLARLPLIRALFPTARVLLALRHPCDVVLSCWMQDFRAPGFVVMFQSIERVAEMYARVFAHWAQWHDALDLNTHLVRYEDLVDNVRATAVPIFNFLGVEWSNNLLNFTEHAATRGAISTPSYAAVTEPVHARAVGRWERYREHFNDAALAHLQPWIERFGYAPRPIKT